MMKHLRDNHIPYRYLFTLNTQTVESRIGTFLTSTTTIDANGANFIGDVKRYILYNKIHLKIKRDITTQQFERVKYYRYSDMKTIFEKNGGVLTKDIFEIDLTKAYWNVAFRMGIINDKIYQSGLLFDGDSKIVRMAALGSLAKKAEVYVNDGTGGDDRYVGQEPPKAKRKAEFLWFKICRETGRIMNRCARAAGDGFLFFWVDGIYVRGDDAVSAVQDVMAENDCAFHLLKIVKIVEVAGTKQMRVYDKEHRNKETGKLEPRLFPMNYSR